MQGRSVQVVYRTIDVLSRVNDVLKLEESLSRLIGDGLIIKSSSVDRASIKRYESNFTFRKRKRKKNKNIFRIKFLPSYFLHHPAYNFVRLLYSRRNEHGFFFSIASSCNLTSRSNSSILCESIDEDRL